MAIRRARDRTSGQHGDANALRFRSRRPDSDVDSGPDSLREHNKAHLIDDERLRSESHEPTRPHETSHSPGNQLLLGKSNHGASLRSVTGQNWRG